MILSCYLNTLYMYVPGAEGLGQRQADDEARQHALPRAAAPAHVDLHAALALHHSEIK